MRHPLWVALSVFLAGCSSEAPDWLSEDGWRAARCRAAAEQIADGRPLEGLGEQWRQVVGAFVATTDQNIEVQSRAANSFGLLGRADLAARFFQDQCAPAALADIRQRL